MEHPAYAAVVLFGLLCGWRFFWLIGVAAGVLSHPISGVFRKKRYDKIARQHGLL